MSASSSPHRRSEPSSGPDDRTATPSLARRFRRLLTYRELLGSLTRRELKVKYKDSVLGFVWTLLNPLLYLAVFTVVFTGFLRANVPLYGVYLLSGLLAWNLFATGVTGATTSITGNGSLVQKVWFPREVLPLSSIGASLVNFCFQFLVLFVGLAVFQRAPEWRLLPLIVPAILVTLVWAVALGVMFSAVNVHFRDVQHFLELILLAWFWLTPIVYQFDYVSDALITRFDTDRLAMANPMVAVVTALQRAIYNPTHELGTEASVNFDQIMRPASWFLQNLAISGAIGLVLLVVGVRVFGRLEADLGEEL